MSRDLSHSLGYVRHCLLEHNMAHLVQCTRGGGGVLFYDKTGFLDQIYELI